MVQHLDVKSTAKYIAVFQKLIVVATDGWMPSIYIGLDEREQLIIVASQFVNNCEILSNSMMLGFLYKKRLY